MKLVIAMLSLVLASCSGSCSCTPSPTPAPDAAPETQQPDASPSPSPAPDTKVVVSNVTDAGAVVNLQVGADSVVQPSSWSFCPDTGTSCSFPLPPSSSMQLPTGGQYLNVSVAFNGQVACGNTLAEATANNPNGYGTADISLVNGWNAKVAIVISGAAADGGALVLGPALDAGNGGTLGVYPVGCDICVARNRPPCGIAPCGSSPNDGGQNCGCHAGWQYNPDVPCQITYQKADAGSVVNFQLVP